MRGRGGRGLIRPTEPASFTGGGASRRVRRGARCEPGRARHEVAEGAGSEHAGCRRRRRGVRQAVVERQGPVTLGVQHLGVQVGQRSGGGDEGDVEGTARFVVKLRQVAKGGRQKGASASESETEANSRQAIARGQAAARHLSVVSFGVGLIAQSYEQLRLCCLPLVDSRHERRRRDE